MGAEKKAEAKFERNESSYAERIVELEMRIGAVEKELRLLTSRLTPETPRAAVASVGLKIECAVGHAMQSTDDYCQECYRIGFTKKPQHAG